MDLSTKLRAFRIEEPQMALIRRFKPTIAEHADEILDCFYAFVQQLPGGAAFFPEPAMVARAKDAQKSHWLDLFADGMTEQAAEVG